jgi:hypothetical protein
MDIGTSSSEGIVMKLLVLACMFCAAAMVAGQSANEKPSDTATIYQLPPMTFQPGRDSAQLPNLVLSPRLDEGSIIHPPAGSFVLQPAKTPTLEAQKLYPGLKLQPVDNAKLEAIPTQWPDFKTENIPTEWPGMKVTPIQMGSATGVLTTSKAKKTK